MTFFFKEKKKKKDLSKIPSKALTHSGFIYITTIDKNKDKDKDKDQH